MLSETASSNQDYAVWGLPGTLIWGLIIAILFVVTQSIAMGLYIGVNYGDLGQSEFEIMMSDLQSNGAVLSICTFASLLVCGPLIIGVVKLKKNSNLKHYLGLQTVDFKTVRFWFIATICLIIASDLLTISLGKPIVHEFMSAVYKSTESPWILWLALIVAAPLFEEMFFRGFIISGISSTFLGSVGAIFISAAAWAVIHFQYDLYGIVLIFVTGVVFGVARIKSGSILLTIGLHSFMNFVATVQTIISLS